MIDINSSGATEGCGAGSDSLYIEVPADASFYRAELDEAFDYRGVQQVRPEQAQPGDTVMLTDGRWGRYLGDGRMRLSGGEWSEFVDQLLASGVPVGTSPAMSFDPLSLNQTVTALRWIGYGQGGFESTGKHGTWRIVVSGQRWHLTVQPTFTRGMLSRGDFGSPEEAKSCAQGYEDQDVAPSPQRIEATGPAPGIQR